MRHPKLRAGMLALPASLLIVLGVGVAKAQTTPALPGCGSYISQTSQTLYGCQQASQIENCSGWPAGYGGNYQVMTADTSTGYTNGYTYSCSAWGRTGDCCTEVNLPACPSDTCAPSNP